ncbi:hypothetical protein QJS04_geneDACA018808 [Acorus gramineus]|uniref:SWIM-type domain-containing protein n=1 Tax=Acorus gramineus TaxID=55184 RepID=A0AAV9BTB1_ACOGR|nr:hypothetical protein QJS04_geneDACA018808 [Acorus gramineus]
MNEKRRGMEVRPSDGQKFEVLARDCSYEVNIEDRTCLCRKWQVTKLPCVHAYAVLVSINESLHTWCDPLYTTETYRKTYVVNIFPIPTIGMPRPELNDIVIKPPTMKKRVGRKKKRRNPSRCEIDTLPYRYYYYYYFVYDDLFNSNFVLCLRV